MEKYLIINADDFGLSHSHNLAIMDLLQRGCITSSTIMAPCAWAREACLFAAENPELAIGVHLTTTCEWKKYRWAPVNASDTGSLRDEEGYMWEESDQFEANAEVSQVVGELKAQIARLRALGLNPSHLDNHMGSLYGVKTGRFDLLPVVFELAGESGLPFRFPGRFDPRMFGNATLDIQLGMDLDVLRQLFDGIIGYASSCGVVMPDYLMPHDFDGPQKESYESFSDYMHEFLRAIPDGVTETYLHPAVAADEVRAFTALWEKREWEYRFYGDEKNQQFIRDCGIKTINYRDLKAMRAK